jgi:hypothetical protein
MNKPGMQSDIVAPEDLQMKWRNEWQDLAAVCRDYVERWSLRVCTSSMLIVHSSGSVGSMCW